ncbi:MAG: hypothetical protein HY319_31200 [Armatimonadetes bacterium]|nr:hypothetical protein [Armatimonadota bacterium]
MEYSIGGQDFQPVPERNGRHLISLAFEGTGPTVHLVRIRTPDGQNGILCAAPWLTAQVEEGAGPSRVFRLLIKPGEVSEGDYATVIELGGHSVGVYIRVQGSGPRPANGRSHGYEPGEPPGTLAQSPEPVGQKLRARPAAVDQDASSAARPEYWNTRLGLAVLLWAVASALWLPSLSQPGTPAAPTSVKVAASEDPHPLPEQEPESRERQEDQLALERERSLLEERRRIEERERTTILRAIEGWRSAWQSRNLDAYMGYYDRARFWSTDKRMDYQAYRAYKAGLFRKNNFIAVDLGPVSIQFDGPARAVVTFLQRYRSDTYSDSGRKTLTFEKRGSAWSITRESFEMDG